MPQTVLVVEDDDTTRDVVLRYLERDGFVAKGAPDATRGQQILGSDRVDLVVLDLVLPDTDGLSLCRSIRSRDSVPIIMLTALGEETDRIVGLELGADDYVTKPFSPKELVTRVKTVLRRANGGAAPSDRVEAGGLRLDRPAREVVKDSVPLKLTPKEFDLLWFLASHPRRVFSRDQLMNAIWGYEAASDTGTVAVHIRRLREKVEDDPATPRLIQTVWGVGYRFSP